MAAGKVADRPDPSRGNMDHRGASMDKSATIDSMDNSEKSPQASSSSTTDESDGASPTRKRGAMAAVRRLFARDRSHHQLYITGLRGVLVIQSFLWIYFQTFIPTLVSNETSGPVYQDLLREIFCVPLWNPSLIYNFFIILSMRTIAVSFLRVPTGQTYAATIIRRNVRMVIIMCTASGMATLIFSRIGTQYIDEFKEKLPNDSITTPVIVENGGAAFNSLFNLFWLSYDHYKQAANTFWPTATLWAPSIMYFQSYTVYFLMVILPFTRPKWHISGLGLFALGSFWMAYWGWFSVTGLLFADLALNPTLQKELHLGLPIRADWRISYKAIAPLFFGVGVAFKYAFTVRPQFANKLLVLHPYLDISSRNSPATVVERGPFARLDDWFVIVGAMLAIELFANVRYFLSFKPLVHLGERSFSIFAAQCIFFWTGGMKLWLLLREEQGWSTAGANGVVFIVGLLAVAVFSELFFRFVDVPSIWLARRTYTWLID